MVQGKKAPLGSRQASNSNGRLEDGKTVEQRYQKKTQLEHILLRPDTYSEYLLSFWFVFSSMAVFGHTLRGYMPELQCNIFQNLLD